MKGLVFDLVEFFDINDRSRFLVFMYDENAVDALAVMSLGRSVPDALLLLRRFLSIIFVVILGVC